MPLNGCGDFLNADNEISWIKCQLSCNFQDFLSHHLVQIGSESDVQSSIVAFGLKAGFGGVGFEFRFFPPSARWVEAN